ncbi:B12-binding domain-containing radical SAM protein [Anaerobaca lacustris]|uniref:Radical SAM protein n=1 Tax=Anaerobaca lacustris TaxID=3044600 RepID=A0AAW6TXF6_9BACT|nr:radical SAM protein [Sedimentisphaerales bacterium M17dextr]
MNRFKVVLVVPNYRWTELDESAFWHITPYNLCLLAAMVRDLCEVQIIDAYAPDMAESEFVDVLQAAAPDLVGVTVMMDQCASAGHRTARLAKSLFPDTPLVMGGVYPTVNPDQVMTDPHVDYTVVGEGEYVFRDLVESLIGRRAMPDKGLSYRKGPAVVHTGRADFIEDLDALPLPAFELIDFERYTSMAPRRSVDGPVALPYARIVTSRGCPVDCVFCQVKRIMGRKFRPRSAESVLGEIGWLKERYAIRSVIFDDDNLFTDRRRARDIFQGMIDRGFDLPWKSTATAVFRLDEELLQLMRRSGCQYICIAIESGTQRVLKEIVGKPVDYTQAQRMVRLARSLGIYVAANFIVGFPTETWDEIRRTIRFAEELDVNYVKLFHAIPLRHTRLWELCEREGAFKKGFHQSEIRWNTGQIESDAFSSQDLTILRAYEWDRINFTDPEKRRQTAAMMNINEAELLAIRRKTLARVQSEMVPAATA